jgi:hypothetical protein
VDEPTDLFLFGLQALRRYTASQVDEDEKSGLMEGGTMGTER